MEENESCQTPNEENGKCIVFKTCGPLFSITQNKPVSEENRKLIADSQCGRLNGKPLVCCPEPDKKVISKEKIIFN